MEGSFLLCMDYGTRLMKSMSKLFKPSSWCLFQPIKKSSWPTNNSLWVSSYRLLIIDAIFLPIPKSYNVLYGDLISHQTWAYLTEYTHLQPVGLIPLGQRTITHIWLRINTSSYLQHVSKNKNSSQGDKAVLEKP